MLEHEFVGSWLGRDVGQPQVQDEVDWRHAGVADHGDEEAEDCDAE